MFLESVGRMCDNLQLGRPSRMILTRIMLGLSWIGLVGSVHGVQVQPPADSGKSDDFPAIRNSPQEDGLLPMPALEAASSFRVPEGFRVTLFASEPEVQNPIAMAWDQEGRVWVAENYTYSDRTQRFDLSMRDRVVVLKDGDGDGRAEQRTVFLDRVQMLTSVEVSEEGVWLLCPPQLLFVPDRDHNMIPDGPAEVVLDGFEVAQDNFHNFANGLRWGPDGWLYGRCGHSCPGRLGVPGMLESARVPLDGGIWRYHPKRRSVEVLCHGTTNPWGHDWDEHGELFFINTVIGHLWHMVPGSHFKEPFGESMNRHVYQRMDMIADHYHFDTRGSWTDSRGGKANDFGGGHAHVGMMIYQGRLWPEAYRQRLFTVNMHGMRINSERLAQSRSGYVGHHGPDFAFAGDPFFRAVELSETPDENMLVIDWSDTGECHEHNGVHRTSGRIFKITYEGNGDRSSRPDRQMAKPWCTSGDGRLQRFWQAYRRETLTRAEMIATLDDPDEHLRAWGIRLLTDHWPLDWLTGPASGSKYPEDLEVVARLTKMASQDSSGLVRRVLASTLQRLPLANRVALASALVARSDDASDENMSMLTWYGIIPVGESSPQELEAILKLSQWPLLTRFGARFLTSQLKKAPDSLPRLLESADTRSTDIQVAMLLGMQDGVRGWRKETPPRGWKAFSQLPALSAHREAIQELNVLFGDGRSMDALRALVKDPKAPIPDRQTALQTLVDARSEGFSDLCRSVIDERLLNLTAARGLSLDNSPATAELLIAKWKKFHPEDRANVLEILVSRPVFAKVLLRRIADGAQDLSSKDLQPTHARQLLTLHDDEISEAVHRVWGSLSETPKERQEEIAKWQARLQSESSASIDMQAGRKLFQKQCAQCHRLFGEGEMVGPDLTGSQRQNLEYLLSNILDPSAVVGKDYRLTIVTTDDGRILNGLAVQQDADKLVLRTATERIVLATAEIESVQQSERSAMPDGLLEPLAEAEVRNLIAYLQNPYPLESVEDSKP